jgi:hypothetical protein
MSTSHADHGEAWCEACYWDRQKQEGLKNLKLALDAAWQKRSRPDLYPLVCRVDLRMGRGDVDTKVHTSDCQQVTWMLDQLADITYDDINNGRIALVPTFLAYEDVLPAVRERRARGAKCCGPALPDMPPPRVRYTGVTQAQRDNAVKSLEKVLDNAETPITDVEDVATLRRSIQILIDLGDLPKGQWQPA